MPRTLYNEGRVVGYSAYEIYCRQLYATDPGATPSDEKSWLAASLAMDSSMLLRVGSDDISGPHYRDIQFPSTSKLSAANTIIASFFIGEGYIGNDVLGINYDAFSGCYALTSITIPDSVTYIYEEY
jgi:hypothetical protein